MKSKKSLALKQNKYNQRINSFDPASRTYKNETWNRTGIVYGKEITNQYVLTTDYIQHKVRKHYESLIKSVEHYLIMGDNYQSSNMYNIQITNEEVSIIPDFYNTDIYNYELEVIDLRKNKRR